MKYNPWATALMITVALGLQVILFQHQQISSLRDDLRLSQRAKDIETDQSIDLMHQLTQAKLENSTLATKYFVAGVVEAVSKPDRYAEVWHAGYDRGTAVQQDADLLKSMYTKSKE
jgi:hypothetical protein